MDTLRERLAELAEHAPTGGAPADELWARGKRAQRLRAVALAAALLMLGAVGTGIGVRLADGDEDRSGPAPVGTVRIGLPITYPVGEELPGLGETPGPVAAIWLVPHFGGAPEAVGLVAETGTFGTLPIDLAIEDDPQNPESVAVALSPDGRRIAYPSPARRLVVHDLVSGEDYVPPSEFETRPGYEWVDATHLVGYGTSGGDADGWMWEPGKSPKLVNPALYLDRHGHRSLSVLTGCPWSPSLVISDRAGRVTVPVFCDAVGLIGSEFVLGHPKSTRSPDAAGDASRGDGTVIALDMRGIRTYAHGSAGPRRDRQFDDPALRHVVVTAGAPARVTFATDLIGEALDADGGAS